MRYGKYQRQWDKVEHAEDYTSTGRFTNTALYQLTSEIQSSLRKGELAISAFLDFEGAFENSSHANVYRKELSPRRGTVPLAVENHCGWISWIAYKQKNSMSGIIGWHCYISEGQHRRFHQKKFPARLKDFNSTGREITMSNEVKYLGLTTVKVTKALMVYKRMVGNP